jgi:hypothetical protein
MDFSAVAARLVCPEVPLADALIQLALRAPRLVRRKLDSRVCGASIDGSAVCAICVGGFATFIASRRTPTYGAVTPPEAG